MRRGAAIDMHLLIRLAVGLDIDQDWWKRAGDRGGRHQQGLEQFQRPRILDGRNLGHVPDDTPTRIEIGGPHQENAALRVLGGDGVQQFLVDIFPDQIP